jgi:cysteinyl-tRNA synthetase
MRGRVDYDKSTRHHNNKFNKTPIPMSISIYNTLTSRKEPFQSMLPQQVSMYCCGVTVYDLCHLGHARSSVVWDTVRRYLEWRGYTVNYVQNFTDIDDKILNRAQTEGLTMAEVSAKYIDAYFIDLTRLNVRNATSYPRATEHIPQIIELVAELEQKGLAYAVAGDVYYRVRKFAEYGKLSGRKLDDMQAGAGGRVAVAENTIKEDPSDFALWKGAKPGEPAWDSPWGKGRPGWHIECSAMIRSNLGQTIDIHCGGNDLVFPHHENEIAQSEGAHHHPLSRYWMHNGMVNVDGEKMSKSLGNFTTIRDLLDRPIDPMVIRLFILTAQYRKPIDFTPEALSSNERSWQTIKEGLLFGQRYGEQLGWDLNKPPVLAPIPAITSSSKIVAEEPTSSGLLLPDTLRPVVEPFQALPRTAQKFSQEYRGLVMLAIALFFSQFPVRFLSRFLDTFNTVPVLPNILEFIGVAVTARTILFKQPRENFFASWRQVISYLFKDRSKASVSPAATAAATISVPAAKSSPVVSNEPYFQQFCDIVDEDFNFAGGLSVIFELAKDLGKAGNILTHGGQIPDASQLEHQWYSLQQLALVLGLEAQLADETAATVGLDDQSIEKLIAERKAARDAKNFKKGDQIRNDLNAQGVVVVDRKGEPTTWYRN